MERGSGIRGKNLLTKLFAPQSIHRLLLLLFAERHGDVPHVLVVGPAAAAEDPEAGARPPQPHVRPRELGGVAGVQLGGGVQLGVALNGDA